MELLTDPLRAQQMAKRPREDVATRRDVKGMAQRLVEGYWKEVRARSGASSERKGFRAATEGRGPELDERGLATMDETLPS